MCHFEGSGEGRELSYCNSIDMGADTEIMVELTGVLRQNLRKYLSHDGNSEPHKSPIIESKREWYCIIDGIHTHTAIICLINVSIRGHHRWAGFKWHVTLVGGSHPIQIYMQLAIMRNSRHSSKYYVPLTFYDLMHRLKQEEHLLLSSGQTLSAAYVENSLDGGGHSKGSTIKEAAANSVRLDDNVIAVVGEIMNSEDSRFCLKTSSLSTDGAKSVEEVIKQWIFECSVTLSISRLLCLQRYS